MRNMGRYVFTFACFFSPWRYQNAGRHFPLISTAGNFACSPHCCHAGQAGCISINPGGLQEGDTGARQEHRETIKASGFNLPDTGVLHKTLKAKDVIRSFGKNQLYSLLFHKIYLKILLFKPIIKPYLPDREF